MQQIPISSYTPNTPGSIHETPIQKTEPKPRMMYHPRVEKKRGTPTSNIRHHLGNQISPVDPLNIQDTVSVFPVKPLVSRQLTTWVKKKSNENNKLPT